MTDTASGALAASAHDLRTLLSGQVITADDAAYDASRQVFNAAVDRRPAVIVRADDAADVARTVTYARERGIELAVRSGGHGFAGHGVTDGGVLLDLSGLRDLAIDVDGRTAWAQAGLTTGEYTAAAAAHGLVTGFGDTPSVGIGGITLGGGLGFLSRKHGLTIDHVLAAEVVTADGDVLEVDAERHPDLFWALRGGGGNFGVVTRLRYRLHEVREVLGGMLILPADPQVLPRFVEFADAAPDELSTVAMVMVAPPAPFIPAEAHGRLVLLVLLVYAGDPEAGQRAVAPLRSIATPISDGLAAMPYTGMFEEEAGPPRVGVTVRSTFLDDFDTRTADIVFEQLAGSTAAMSNTQIRVMGGAVGRVPVDATAFAHRGRRMMIGVGAGFMDPAEAATHEAWLDGYLAALRPAASGAFVNFMRDEGPARVREAYPGGTYERLRAVKRRYDPDNLFRLNQNIPPAPD